MPSLNGGTVDERIVEMRIDHDKFESGAKKTLNILEKLDGGLKALGLKRSDGFDQIGETLERVNHRFSALGTIGDQVLRNLTNKAIELVGQLRHVANELTLDQIGVGWNKYAEKTQGVQTIMAATAKDWEDQGAQMEWVNAQLEKLNWFTDETSYNFLEMVNNIGKFTSNGVKLETAVTSMEGISTWAALSGANANEASRAMYNLSQALATGTVKLIDWKSIENANMATREFKELALETAVSLGTLSKVGEGTYKTLGEKGKEFTTEQFNTELSEGWFTSDVLLSVLNQYGQFTDVLNAASNATDLTATEMLEAVDAYEKGEEGLHDIQRICDKSHLSIEELMPWLEKLSSDTYDLGRRAFKAAQEAKTFKEAIDATKDAVSTSWMNIFETIFGSYLEAKEFWTDVAESLYNIFAEPINQLGELVDLAFGDKLNREMDELHAQANFDELTAGLHDLGYSFQSFEDAYRRIDGKTVDDLVSKYGSLENAIKKGAVSAKDFQDIMLMLAGTNEYISKTPVYDSAGHIKAFEPVYHKIITLTGERLAIYNKLIGASGRLTNTEESGLEHITTGSELFTEGLANMLGVIEDVTGAIEHAMQLLFGDNTDPNNIIPWTDVLGAKLYGSLEKFNEFAEALRFDEEKGEIEALGEKIAAVASVFVTARNIISSVFGFLMSVVAGIMTALGQSHVIEHIFKAISNVVQGLLAPLRFFASLVQSAFETLAGEKLGDFNWVQILTRFFMQLGIRLEILSKRFREFMESEETAAKVTKVFEKIRDTIQKCIQVVTTLVRLFNTGFKRDGLIGGLEAVYAGIKVALRNHPIILKALTSIERAFRAIKTAVNNVKDGIVQIIDRITKNGTIQNFINGFKNIWAGLIAPFKQLFDQLRKILGIGDKVEGQTWIEKISEWFKSSDTVEKLSRFISILGVKFAYFSAKFREFMESTPEEKLEKIRSKFEGLYKFITFISSAVSKLKSVLSAALTYIRQVFEKHGLTNIFENISTEGLGATISKFVEAVGDIIASAFNAVFKEGGIFDSIKPLIGPAFLALIGSGIYGAIKKVKKVIGGIGETFETITNFVKNFTKKPSGFKSFAKNLLIIAVSIGIVALALIGLAKLSWDDLLKGWLGISAILLSIMFFMQEADTAKGIGAGSLIAMALTVLVLAGALKSLAKLSWDNLLKGWLGISAILLSIMFFMKEADTAKGTGAGSLIAMALTVLILASTLKGLAKLSWDNLLKGWLGISAILLSIMFFMKEADTAKGTGAGSLIAMALTVLVLAGALKSLAKLSWDNLLKGWLGISAILLSIMFFMKEADTAKGTGAGSLIAMALTVLVLAGALKKLAKLSWDELLRGWLGITAVLLSMMLFMKEAKSSSVSQKSMLVMLEVAIIAVIIGGVLGGLAKFPGRRLIAAAASLALCIIAIAGSMAIINKFGGDLNPVAIASLLAGVIVLIAIGWALGQLAAYDWKTIGPVALICLATMAGLAGTIVILGKIPLSGIAKGLLALTIVVGGIALIVWGLIALGGPIVDSAKQLAVKLNEFAVSLQPFIDTISGFTDDTSASFDRFASMMLNLMEAQFWMMLAGVLSYLTDGEALATKLSGFMANIQPFLNNITTLTEEHVTKAGYLKSMMESLTAGQFWASLGSLFGGLDASYGGTLSSFTTNLRPFLTDIAVLSEEHVIKAGYLTSLIEALTVGQFWASLGSLFGGLDSDYATKLSDFAISLQPFLTNISSLTEEHSTQAGYLTSLMETLTAGQFWASLGDLFNGLNSENGQKLSDFMVSLEGFLTSVGSIDQAKLDGASNLSTIMRTAFGTNFWTSVGQWFSGDNVAYGDKMSSFAGAIVPFLDTMGSIGADMVTNVTATMELLNGINKNNTIATFGAQLQAFYQNLEGNGSFLTGGAGVVEKDLSSFQLAIQMLQEFVGVLQSLAALGDGIELGLNIITSVSAGITDNESDLTSAISTATRNALVSARNSTYSVAYNNGANIVRGVVSGINANVGLATAAAVSLASSINSAFASTLEIKSPSRAMARLAAYIPAGVAVGIEHNSGVAVDSITVLGSSILAAMQMAMLKVATVADERFDITPVITPVVDTTNMDYAAGMAGGMFRRITSGLRGTIDVNADRADALASAANASTDKGSMFGEIQRLSDKLDSLGDALMGMQIVLDTGELVGATSPQMDAAFGTMQMRKGRGN